MTALYTIQNLHDTKGWAWFLLRNDIIVGRLQSHLEADQLARDFNIKIKF